MTLLHVSDEQLSRMIAEHLEPMPEGVSIAEYGVHGKGCWRKSYNGQWETRDMVNDPAMTVTLLAHHGFVSLNFIEDGAKFYEACFCGESSHSEECGAKMETATNTRLGRAVAEAYALANHLEAKA